MPWTASSFRSRHNHKLTTAQASQAAKIANGMIKRGVDEGVAIATANKQAKGARKSSDQRREGRYGK